MNLKKQIQLLQKISPKLTARIAFKFISKPENRKIRPFEKSILKIATTNSIKFKNFKIKTYKWGDGSKKALLVHGWGGRASNFGAIVPELTENGYTVLSFDGPSHGDSTKKKTSFFEMSDLVKFYLEQHTFDLIITHSMGSVLTFTAMGALKYKAKQMIVLTTPFKFIQFIELAVVQYGLTKATTNLLIDKIKKTTAKYDPLTFGIETVIDDIFVNDLALIHDINDKVLSIENTRSANALFQDSKLIEIEGTGHFRMLWSKKVVGLIHKLTSEK